MQQSQSIQNIKIPYPVEGIIRTAQLDDTIAPEDSVQLAVNMNFDMVGGVQTRPGVENYGGTFPSSVLTNILSMASLQVKGAVPIASLSELNQNAVTPMYTGSFIGMGQSFAVTQNSILQNVSFYLKKTGSPTGSITATIYLATGTLGTTSIPTGSPLATSGPIDASTLTTSFGLKSFIFSGTQRINLSSGVNYVIVLNFNGGSISDTVDVGLDSSSPTASGNQSLTSDFVTWSAFSGIDLIFYVYASTPTGFHRLFVQIEDTYVIWDQSTWQNLGTFGQPIKARWAQFLNYMWRVNGANNSAVVTSNGGAFGTTLVPADFPSGDYISAGFEGRVWVADSTTDVIYYTDIVQFTPPNTYVLTFDPETNFIQNFSPQDGQTITGLFRVPRALLVFKQNSIYRIYGASSVDSYPAYNVGTYSQESIVQAKDGIYFHHSSGFYQFNYDGQPIEISRRIIDFVRAIPASKYDSIVGIWDQYDSVKWAIGPVTVEGITFNNCVVRYTISTQVWTIYDYETKIFNSMIVYNDGTSINQIVGTYSNLVLTDVIGKMDSGYKDFSKDIYYDYIDRWRSYTDMYSKVKSISGVNIYSKNAAGAKIEYQLENTPVNTWKSIGSVNENNNSLFPNASTDDFEVSRLRISGYTKGQPVIIHGIEILSINDKGFNQN